MTDKQEGSLMLQVYFHRTLGVDYHHKLIIFHVNDTTEQAITKILTKGKISRLPEEFALYYLDKSGSHLQTSKKGSKTSPTWMHMADGSNLSSYGLLAKDKIEIRPKYVISFQFPDDTTKTIPCDYKMPINEALQFIFEDDACKRFAGLYLYDGETRLDTSMSFIEQGLRYNATVFFRHTDVAPQKKKRQATLTNYRLSMRMEPIKMQGGFQLEGSATESADFFATQIKTNVSASILTKMHSVASSLEGASRENWIQGFIDLDGLELLTSVIAQIDAAMIKLAPDLDMLYSCIRCVRLIGSTECGKDQLKRHAKRYMRLLSDQLNTENKEQKCLVMETLSIICDVQTSNVTSSSNSEDRCNSSTEMNEVNTQLLKLGATIQLICDHFSSAKPRPFISTTSPDVTLNAFNERISAFDSALKLVEACIVDKVVVTTTKPPTNNIKLAEVKVTPPESETKEQLKSGVATTTSTNTPLADTTAQSNVFSSMSQPSLGSASNPHAFPANPSISLPSIASPSFNAPNMNFSFGQNPTFGAVGFVPSASLMGIPPSVTQSPSAPPQSPTPLASSPTIISIQESTPDPLEQRVKAVKTEAGAIADSLLLSLRSLETATATSVIAVAKVLKEFKPQMSSLHPFLPKVVNTPFEPTPGKDKLELLKDASRLTISDLIANIELAKISLNGATPTDAVQIAKVLRTLKLPSL